jgi:hypothetical protein
METIELRSSIHKIVDRLESEQLLKTLYDFLKVQETQKSGSSWSTLTDEQRQEIILAYEESEDEENLINANEVFKMK